MKTKTIEVSGIPVIVERKKIKNMYIRVLPPDGQVKVSAPYRASDTVIQGFIISHLNWISKAKERIAKQPVLVEYQYVTGEQHALWGKSYVLGVVTSESKNYVGLSDDRMILHIHDNSTAEQRKQVIEEWYRNELKKAIPDALERCVQIVGKRPNEWRIKNMKTKWGTCNIMKKRIWLNLQLAKKPPECLDYVITHELVHLYEKNHNQAFRAYMDQFYPDWRNVKKRLNS